MNNNSDYRCSVSRNLAYIRAMVCLVQKMDSAGIEDLFRPLNSILADCLLRLIEDGTMSSLSK